MRLTLSSALAIGLLLTIQFLTATAAITPGQVDDFEDPLRGLEGWQAGGFTNPNRPMRMSGGAGGASDDFMQLTSNGSFQAGGKLVVFNTNEWAGDFLAAGIISVDMMVRNLGSNPLVLRLILLDESHSQSLTTSTPVNLPAGGGWTSVSFPLNSTNLTGGVFDNVMKSITSFNLVHSPTVINHRNAAPNIAAMLGVDNITAVPNVIPAATWNVDMNGNWTVATNWTVGVPNSTGTEAILGPIITAPRTVTVNGAVTVGTLDFDNTNAYTVAGASTLTFDVANGEAEINVIRGSHTISAPVTMSDDTRITVTPAASNLTMSGGVAATAADLTKLGAGTLTVNNVRAASLSINAGKVAIAPGTPASALSTLTIAGTAQAPTAQLDMNGAMVLNYTGTSPEEGVRQRILAGRGGPSFGASWSGMGINSSVAAAAQNTDPESRSVAYVENAALPLGPYTNFRGQAVDDTSVLIALARTGDATLDGIVNDDDVTIVGATYAPGVAQASWALGDFDYNGFVDDDDITLLGVFYDPAAPPLAAPIEGSGSLAAVPEPSTLALAALASLSAAIAGARRWSKRR
jgi:hypothetical protein